MRARCEPVGPRTRRVACVPRRSRDAAVLQRERRVVPPRAMIVTFVSSRSNGSFDDRARREVEVDRAAFRRAARRALLIATVGARDLAGRRAHLCGVAAGVRVREGDARCARSARGRYVVLSVPIERRTRYGDASHLTGVAGTRRRAAGIARNRRTARRYPEERMTRRIFDVDQRRFAAVRLHAVGVGPDHREFDRHLSR